MSTGGMQLPKRWSSGSYRDLSLATIYSQAKVIEPSNTSIQTGSEVPMKSAAAMAVVKANMAKASLAFEG